ncbi:MAG: hypothetical protein AAFX52_04705 [Pseudomonadota bacterium]
MRKALVAAIAAASALSFGVGHAAPIFASTVDWFDNGTNPGGARADTDNATGAPDQTNETDINFFSLGLSTEDAGFAYAFFGFDEAPIQGSDATVFEVTYGCGSVVGGGCASHPEAVNVYYGSTLPGTLAKVEIADVEIFTKDTTDSGFGFTLAGTVKNGEDETTTLTISEEFSYILLVDVSRDVFSGTNSQDGFDVDAIVLNPVPVPGAALLMGSVLVAGAARHRRKS